jgi:hypothetical protein
MTGCHLSPELTGNGAAVAYVAKDVTGARWPSAAISQAAAPQEHPSFHLTAGSEPTLYDSTN